VQQQTLRYWLKKAFKGMIPPLKAFLFLAREVLHLWHHAIPLEEAAFGTDKGGVEHEKKDLFFYWFFHDLPGEWAQCSHLRCNRYLELRGTFPLE
jgi:hypothetical protein